MAHHLTPAELADQLQMEQQEVLGKCVEMGIPVFHGRIDRTLFEASLRDVKVSDQQKSSPDAALN